MAKLNQLKLFIIFFLGIIIKVFVFKKLSKIIHKKLSKVIFKFCFLKNQNFYSINDAYGINFKRNIETKLFFKNSDKMKENPSFYTELQN